MRLKHYDNPGRVARALDWVAFTTVQGLVALLLFGLYAVASFEVAVIAALSIIVVQVAES